MATTDDTNPARQGPRRWPSLSLICLIVAGLAACGTALWSQTETPVLPPLATEAELIADVPAIPRLTRFTPAPAIFVLQFPSLQGQGRALNRAAALIEKQGFPRDRVLDDAELDRRIRAHGSTPETFYFGHDYRAADILRFFAMAKATSVILTLEEQRLETMLQTAGWRDGMGAAALVTFAARDDAAGNDSAARATILKHELSHGEFFTNPAYAAFVRTFWATLPSQDRQAMTGFLVAEHYDAADQDLLANEAQAYLMHTSDARFFSAQLAGLTKERVRELRRRFHDGMPAGWLRNSITLPRVRSARTGRRRPVRHIGLPSY